MTASRVTLRLLFADQGAFHHEDVRVSSEALMQYERLVDFLQEDPEVLRRVYVDLTRLCSAQVLDE